MGAGIDAARAAGAGIHADVLDNMKDQLILVLIRRLVGARSGKLAIPVDEIDDTGGQILSFELNMIKREFVFELGQKS